LGGRIVQGFGAAAFVPSSLSLLTANFAAGSERSRDASTWLWRSPHRRVYLVNATGTHPLCDTDFAEAIWHAANPPQELAS
jgi:MFS family permease